jgi:hypothetical protein
MRRRSIVRASRKTVKRIGYANGVIQFVLTPHAGSTDWLYAASPKTVGRSIAKRCRCGKRAREVHSTRSKPDCSGDLSSKQELSSQRRAFKRNAFTVPEPENLDHAVTHVPVDECGLGVARILRQGQTANPKAAVDDNAA